MFLPLGNTKLITAEGQSHWKVNVEMCFINNKYVRVIFNKNTIVIYLI